MMPSLFTLHLGKLNHTELVQHFRPMSHGHMSRGYMILPLLNTAALVASTDSDSIATLLSARP